MFRQFVSPYKAGLSLFRLANQRLFASTMSAAPQLYTIKDLTEDQKDLIKASVPILELSGVELTKTFYNYMLNTYPEVKPFFNETNQVTLKQPRVLAFALLNYAKNIDDLTPLTDFVNQIVIKHVGLQIKAEHYPYVGNSLITTMGNLLGEKIATPEFVEAWSTAYGNLAQILINAEWSQYQNQDWQGFRDFKVTKLEDEGSEVKSVYFTPADGGKIATPVHGQYLGFRFSPPGSTFEKSREYSISQFPENNEYRISVRKLDGGVVSTFVHDQLKVGDIIKVCPPTGRFLYQENDKDVVAFAGGIGITPIVPIISKALDDGKKVTLLYSNRSADSRAFGDYFGKLQKENPNFTLKEYLSTEKKLEAGDFEGLDLASKEVYMLGPIDYMKFVRPELEKNGVAKINSEYFGPTDV